MHIGLMGALPQEVELLKEDLAESSHTELGRRNYHSGSLHGHAVTLVHSRMGKVASASTATTLVTQFDVDAVVFVGVAGRLDDDLDIGDVVIATDLVQHDLQSNPKEFKRGEVPLLGIRELPTDDHLRSAAATAAREFFEKHLDHAVGTKTLRDFQITKPKVVLGRVASGDEFIHGELRDLVRARAPQAKCVEMEGAAVAQVCYEHGKPVCIIRAISDRAGDKAPIAFPEFRDRLARHYARGIIRAMFELLATQRAAS